MLISAAPTNLPYLFSSSLTLALCSPPCLLLRLSFYLNLSGISERNCFFSPPLLSGYNGLQSFILGNDAVDELARRGALHVSSTIPCSLSPLTSRIHSSLFSVWRDTVSSNFFDTQIPLVSSEELMFSGHARCALSRFRCNGHSLLLSSYLSRIGRIENPSRSACGYSSQDTSYFILHYLAADSLHHLLFGDSLSLYDLWFRPWRVARLMGNHGVPPCPHLSEEVG